MKYCLKCGKIIADNSMFKDRKVCSNCNIPFQEDNMTGEMFESFSESEKQRYANELLKKIKNSDIFDEKIFKEHHEGAALYHCWWFDKYEELGGKFSARYETDEERKQRLDREYGKDSPAYQQAVVQNCINFARAKETESSNIPKCPTCSSTNIRKIGAVESGASIALFGIFSKKINKTFKCKDCGYTW